MRTYTGYMGHIRGMPKADGELEKYSATYGQGSTGYEGGLFAKNIAPRPAHRRIREIAYEGIGVRD